jgi:hypothetical protein
MPLPRPNSSLVLTIWPTLFQRNTAIHFPQCSRPLGWWRSWKPPPRACCNHYLVQASCRSGSRSTYPTARQRHPEFWLLPPLAIRVGKGSYLSLRLVRMMLVARSVGVPTNGPLWRLSGFSVPPPNAMLSALPQKSSHSHPASAGCYAYETRRNR